MFTFAKFCRLCLQNSDILVNYSEEDLDGISCYDKIKKFLPELVTPCCENLPKLICASCREQLDYFYLFRKKCLDTDILLKQYNEQLLSLKILNTALNADLHSLPNNKLHKDAANLKTGTTIIAVDENSTDSNISIVKNEIPVTEEEEQDFKLLIKTMLKPETDLNTSIPINDDITNNTDENVNVSELEIKQQIMSPVYSNNNQHSQSPTLTDSIEAGSNKSDESIKIKNSENNSVQISEKPTRLSPLLETDENLLDSDESFREVSTESSGNETDGNSTEKLANPPKLKLRIKRRSTSILYNERSDNEDFSADDDDSDFQPEKGSNIGSALKKAKYSHENASKLSLTSTGSSSSTDKSKDYRTFRIFTSGNTSKTIIIDKSKCTNIVSPPLTLNTLETNLINAERLKQTDNPTIRSESVSSSSSMNNVFEIAYKPQIISNDGDVSKKN